MLSSSKGQRDFATSLSIPLVQGWTNSVGENWRIRRTAIDPAPSLSLHADLCANMRFGRLSFYRGAEERIGRRSCGCSTI
jgi:hypothetical protein